MIKYLSGDLSPEESLAFDMELSEDQELQKDFSDVSQAYRIISEQVKREDEEAYTLAVKAAMDKTLRVPDPPKKRPSRRWIFLVALAASLAIILSIFGPSPEKEKIYASNYNPSNDPVIVALKGNMRGEAGHQSISDFWNKEDYLQSKGEAERILSKNSSDEFAILFYLLSSMELNEGKNALERMPDFQWSMGQSPGQAISWYRALALIRSGNTPEALAELSALEELRGPYQKDAHKLKKKLQK